MLYHLSWNENGDRLDVAIAVNRIVASGGGAYRLQGATGTAEAGDYLADISERLAAALAGRNIVARAWPGSLPGEVEKIAPVKIAVLAGEASAYPYYGYYALALARLGYAYRPVSGEDIAAGALDEENLLVLPGGFSNWSLDAKEHTAGADMAVRHFFGAGGAAVVSCGGAYYLAKGRSTWLGVADARPYITQDYLRTGVGMVTCRLEAGRHRLGLPPTFEIPYFHGPAFDEIGENCQPLAHFRELNATGRLFIDNPLTPDSFATYLGGRIAAMKTEGARGRAILFSPHPEMGDLLAKYMTLEGYIPKYLPIRGALVMQETLDAYRPEESRSFLMVLNAIEDMAGAARPAPEYAASPESAPLSSGDAALQALAEEWERRAGTMVWTEGGLGALEQHVMAGLRRRLPDAVSALARSLPQTAATGGEGRRLVEAFSAIAGHAVAAWQAGPSRRPAELLLELELALLLIEAWSRLSDLHNLCRADA